MSDPLDRANVLGERTEAVERVAPGYCEATLEAEHSARYRWAAERVRGKRVLDVACGVGYGAEILRGRGARFIVSADRSSDALRFGRARYSLLAVEADAHRLPFSHGAFDVVVSLETIEHLSEPARFLREVGRVLRPGGELLLSTPNADLSDGRNPYHLSEMTLNELRAILRAAGFQVNRVYGQRWRLRARFFHRMRGFRRLGWELQKKVRVLRGLVAIAEPTYWCLAAVRSDGLTLRPRVGPRTEVKVGT